MKITTLEWQEPTQEKTKIANWHVWKTTCERFNIVRSESRLSEGESYFAVQERIGDSNKTRILKNNLRSLDSCFSFLERHLQEKEDCEVIQNDMSTVEKSEKFGLCKLPKNGQKAVDNAADNLHNTSIVVVALPIQKEGAQSVQIKESEARGLLTAVGMSKIEQCKFNRITSKINNLPLVQAELKQPEDPKDQTLLRSVLDALQEGNKIEIVPDAEPAPAAVTEQAETKESPEVNATKNKKNVKASKKNTDPKVTKKGTKNTKVEKKSVRPKIFGMYSVGSFVRFLGRKGVDFDLAKKILKDQKAHLSDPSIQWELKEEREERKPAEVSKEHLKELKSRYAIK